MLGTVPVVYYVTNTDRPGQVKIGTTTDVHARARELRGRRGQGQVTTLLAVEVGGRDVERMRHAQFADMRLDGEWFTFGAPIISHIMRLDQAPVIVSNDWHWMPVAEPVP